MTRACFWITLGRKRRSLWRAFPELIDNGIQLSQALRSESTQRFVATGETVEFVEGELSGITLSFDVEWNCARDASQPLMARGSEPRPVRLLKAQALGAFTASELVGQTIAVSLGDLEEEGDCDCFLPGRAFGGWYGAE